MREATVNKIFHYVLLGLLGFLSIVTLSLALWNLLLPEEFCWMQERNAISCVVIGGAFSFLLGVVVGSE